MVVKEEECGHSSVFKPSHRSLSISLSCPLAYCCCSGFHRPDYPSETNVSFKDLLFCHHIGSSGAAQKAWICFNQLCSGKTCFKRWHERDNVELTERRGSLKDSWTQVWHTGDTHEAIRQEVIRAPEEGPSCKCLRYLQFCVCLNRHVRLKQKLLHLYLDFFCKLMERKWKNGKKLALVLPRPQPCNFFSGSVDSSQSRSQA